MFFFKTIDGTIRQRYLRFILNNNLIVCCFFDFLFCSVAKISNVSALTPKLPMTLAATTASKTLFAKSVCLSLSFIMIHPFSVSKSHTLMYLTPYKLKHIIHKQLYHPPPYKYARCILKKIKYFYFLKTKKSCRIHNSSLPAAL